MKKRVSEIYRLYRVINRYNDAANNCDSLASKRHFREQVRFYERKLNHLQSGLPSLKIRSVFDPYQPHTFNWLWMRIDTTMIDVLRSAGYRYNLSNDKYAIVEHYSQQPALSNSPVRHDVGS